eukprot:jgi/Tetstr1/433502/TSEL_022772.t1
MFVTDNQGRTALRTPGLLARARDLFGCPTLVGVPLEDGGGSGSVGSHWESAHVRGDYMGPSVSPNGMNGFGPLTMALAEDSGWYLGNWDNVAHMEFGYKAGCAFMDQPCWDYAASATDQRYFCSSVDSPLRCSSDHFFKAGCQPSPTFHDGCFGRYEPQRLRIQDDATGQSSIVIGECFDASMELINRGIYGEFFGSNSRCIDVVDRMLSPDGRWSDRPKCLQMSCTSGGKLQLHLGSEKVDCPTGERVEVDGLGGFSGSFGPCPDNEDICASLTCPNDCNGNGHCIDGSTNPSTHTSAYPSTHLYSPATNRGAIIHRLGDDDSVEVPFAQGFSFPFLQASEPFTSVFVGSNGYLTFQQGDSTRTATYDNHNSQPRISGLFTDLVPDYDYAVSYQQLADMFVVRYNRVLLYGSSVRVSFQIVLSADGSVSITYLGHVPMRSQAIVGLSHGVGTFAMNLTSAATCEPPAVPGAQSVPYEVFASGAGLPGARTLTFAAPDYSACSSPWESPEYPVNTRQAYSLSLDDDDFAEISFTQGFTFDYLQGGSPYRSVFVGSNGYLTFEKGEAGYMATGGAHKSQPRVAGLFTDLTPVFNVSGISYQQFVDVFVVTYHKMLEYGSDDRLSSFQIFLFADGSVAITYVGQPMLMGPAVVGLSQGWQSQAQDLLQVPNCDSAQPLPTSAPTPAPAAPTPTPPMTTTPAPAGPSSPWMFFPDGFELRDVIVSFESEDLEYTVCTVPWLELNSISTPGATVLSLGDDDFAEVPFTAGFAFDLLRNGDPYRSVFVGSNGYLTFEQGDISYSVDSTSMHNSPPRVAGLYADLTPVYNTSVISYFEYSDLFVVTYHQMREFGSEDNWCSFQIVLFRNGTVDIGYVGQPVLSGPSAVGISRGGSSYVVDLSESELCWWAVDPNTPAPTLPPALGLSVPYEQFDAGVDLNDAILFYPANEYSSPCVSTWDRPDYPYTTEGARSLSLSDDDFAKVNFTQGFTFDFLQSGEPFSSVFVGSNGYLTFQSGDESYSVRAANHMGKLRVAGLFADLSSDWTSGITYEQYSDAFVVTYHRMLQYGSTDKRCSFQIMLFLDGGVGIVYLGQQMLDAPAIVGLSQGGNAFVTDLSQASCDDLPGALSTTPPPVGLVLPSELFWFDDVDLGNSTLTFAAPDFAVCRSPWKGTRYPVDNATAIPLRLGDDDSVEVPFAQGFSFPFLQASEPFTSVFVGSNGYLTFQQGDSTRTATYDNHNSQPRISGLFTDLAPDYDYAVSYQQLADMFVVRYNRVLLFGSGVRVSFQIVLSADGSVSITYLGHVPMRSQAIVGLSHGAGTYTMDLSDAATCEPPAVPGAQSV